MINKLFLWMILIISVDVSACHDGSLHLAKSRSKATSNITQQRTTNPLNKTQLDEVRNVKKLLKAYKSVWGDPAPGIIEIFNRIDPLAILPLRELIMSYYMNEFEVPLVCGNVTYEYYWIDSQRCDSFFPIQELKFNNDGTQLTAFFARCTQEQYKTQKELFEISGSRSYNLLKPLEKPVEKGSTHCFDFYDIAPRHEGSFCGKSIIQEQTIGTSDDGLLQARNEFSYCTTDPKHPDKLLVPREHSQFIYMSIYVHVTKIVRAILTPGFLELGSSCVIQ